jgi:hypothetical protein
MVVWDRPPPTAGTMDEDCGFGARVREKGDLRGWAVAVRVILICVEQLNMGSI